jgi:maltose O-acetyltransferase
MKVLTEAERLYCAKQLATLDPTAKIHPSAEIRNYLGDPKAITIGAHTNVYGELLTFWDRGRISIGEWSTIGEGSRIWSHISISIGNRVLISPLVDIQDTNGHPIDLEGWRQDVQAQMTGKLENRVPERIIAKPVVIEDDVWIGFKATVLKGVHIGRGAIVRANSVVVKDVPALTVVAGNPAEVIREFEKEDLNVA